MKDETPRNDSVDDLNYAFNPALNASSWAECIKQIVEGIAPAARKVVGELSEATRELAAIRENGRLMDRVTYDALRKQYVEATRLLGEAQEAERERNTFLMACSKHKGMPWTFTAKTTIPSRIICPHCDPQINRVAATREQRLGSVADGEPSTAQGEAIPRTGDVKSGSIPDGPAVPLKPALGGTKA